MRNPNQPLSVIDLNAVTSKGDLVVHRDCRWPSVHVGPSLRTPVPPYANNERHDVLHCSRVMIPAFTKACYFAPFQKYAIAPSVYAWPEGYNQCHPLPVTSFENVKRGGLFTLLALADGSYLALLPLVTGRLMSWFRGDADGLLLESGHWGTAGYDGDAPVLAWARDTNPYRACEQAWRLAAADPAAGEFLRLRHTKTYPEPFDYLGWCTWEEFKQDIDEILLNETLDALHALPVPFRWFLVDDGHLEVLRVGDNRNTEEGAEMTGDRLAGLGVDPMRFPRGWRPLFKKARATKFRWLGVWLNFNGYWGGIAGPNYLPPALQAMLREVSPGQWITDDCPEAAAVFYDALVAAQSEAGFDFIKVDNQAKSILFYIGRVPNAVAAASANHRGLEQAVARRLDGMINCMAHNNICATHTTTSQITRSSEDYRKGDLWRAKHHLNNSYHNMLWLGQTVWGDHDMFHSSDGEVAALFARNKAISGGPIYVSDRPEHIDAALVKRLCFEDGRILRPLAPAVPAPESLFVNTYEDDRAYRVIAPLPNRAAAFISYNLTHPGKPVSGFIQGADYTFVPGMMQDGEATWAFPSEGVLAYDVARRSAQPLGRDDRIVLDLPTFGDTFHLLVPIRHGWAVLGRVDKFLAPAGVGELTATPTALDVMLPEQGPLLLWRRDGMPATADGTLLQSQGDGLWLLDAPVQAGAVRIHLKLS